MRILIEAGADLNIQNNEGFTALLKASNRGDFDSVRMLIRAGADLDYALMWASAHGHRKTVGMLLESGASVNESECI